MKVKATKKKKPKIKVLVKKKKTPAQKRNTPFRRNKRNIA